MKIKIEKWNYKLKTKLITNESKRVERKWKLKKTKNINPDLEKNKTRRGMRGATGVTDLMTATRDGRDGLDDIDERQKETNFRWWIFDGEIFMSDERRDEIWLLIMKMTNFWWELMKNDSVDDWAVRGTLMREKGGGYERGERVDTVMREGFRVLDKRGLRSWLGWAIRGKKRTGLGL